MAELINFTSLIQISIAFNFAFVAVSGGRTFANILSENYFDIDDLFEDKFKEIWSADISGETTLASMDISNRSVVECQNSFNELNDKKEQVYRSTLDKIHKRVREIISEHLFLFIGCYGLILLFLIGFENHLLSESFIDGMNFVTLFFLLSYFVIEKKRILHPESVIDTSYSIQKLLGYSTIILIISFMYTLFNYVYVTNGVIYINFPHWVYFRIFLSSILPFSSFIIYFLLVNIWKNKYAAKEIDLIFENDEGINMLKKELDILNDKIAKLDNLVVIPNIGDIQQT